VEDSDNTNTQLDSLFKQAKESKPVMDINEVRNIIAAVPAPASISKKSNNLKYIILLGLLLISSGLFLYLNKDTAENVTSAQITNETTQPNVIIETPTDNHSNIQQPIEQSKDELAEAPTANAEDVINPTTKNTDAEVKTENTDKNIEKPNKTNAQPILPEALSTKTSIITGSDMEVTLNENGNNIKMKVNTNNAVKELVINGKSISENDFGKYKNYIEQGIKIAGTERMSKEVAEPNTKTAEEQKRDEINTNLFNAITEQLKKDKLVTDSKYSFKLSAAEMLIDGKALPQVTQAKYLKLFETTSGRSIGNATFKFEHGLK